jgi:hypothetical protein
MTVDSKCVSCPSNSTCKQGEYYSQPGVSCSCSKCSVQPSTCTSAGLFYNFCEGTGTENDGACNGTEFSCGTQCDGINTYEKVACNKLQGIPTQCSQCLSIPPEGYYRARDCSEKMPQEFRPCSPLPPTGCVPGSSYFEACSETSDWKCTNCRQLSYCPLSTHYISGCRDGGPLNRECVTRTSMQKICNESGTYRRKGTNVTDNYCAACDPPCVEGVSWEATSCFMNANRRCENCSKGLCPAGMFRSGNCSELKDRSCEKCSYTDGWCPEGTYMASDCSHETDRTCMPCTRVCPAGKYMAYECNATHDASCVDCSTDEKQEEICGSLPYKAFVIPCSRKENSR